MPEKRRLSEPRSNASHLLQSHSSCQLLLTLSATAGVRTGLPSKSRLHTAVPSFVPPLYSPEISWRISRSFSDDLQERELCWALFLRSHRQKEASQERRETPSCLQPSKAALSLYSHTTVSATQGHPTKCTGNWNTMELSIPCHLWSHWKPLSSCPVDTRHLFFLCAPLHLGFRHCLEVSEPLFWNKEICSSRDHSWSEESGQSRKKNVSHRSFS